MMICRVMGTVVGSVKHPAYDGHKLMAVRRLDTTGKPTSKSFLAIDIVQAGPGDVVLVVQEGSSTRDLVAGGRNEPVHATIMGIVDEVAEGLSS
ncbi:MAG: EutN/CcmL family microcompartment protein [Planctomycetota bacterium]